MNGSPKHRGFNPEKVDIIWKQWKLGDTLSDIGRALRKHVVQFFM